VNILVVDDESLARARLRALLAESMPGAEIAEAADGSGALLAVDRDRPDVVLLDISMPGMSGLEVARRLAGRTPVIFVTAYDAHAVEAFEAEAVDYLLKPVSKDRLDKALARVRDRDSAGVEERLRAVEQRLSAGLAPRISAHYGDATHVFDPKEIARFSAGEKYVSFRVDGKEFLTEASLSSLEERLASQGFVRVHRSELVQLAKVRTLRRESEGVVVELTDGQIVPVSRRHLQALRHHLGL
jgi:DNA-binding LytR/AlgR family response regulator